MIYEVLNFLKLRLETFLAEGRVNSEPLITLSNPWSNNDSNKNSSFLNAMTLVNIEEEKIFKTQGHQIVPSPNGGYYKREPDLKLNLYVLISAYNKNYEDGLKFISKVVGYFQRNSVFNKQADTSIIHEDLPANIEKIIMELYTTSFDQQNQIWGSLNTGYIPSLLYKVRMLIVDTDTNEREYTGIGEIKASY